MPKLKILPKLGSHGTRTTDLSLSRRDLNRSATEALREKVVFDHYLNQVRARSPNTPARKYRNGI